MRHPSLDKRAAQFMFASPRRAKHVRTSSCANALARMSYTRGLASFFIVATPASNSLLDRCDQRRSHVATGRTRSAVFNEKLGVIELVISREEVRESSHQLQRRAGLQGRSVGAGPSAQRS